MRQPLAVSRTTGSSPDGDPCSILLYEDEIRSVQRSEVDARLTRAVIVKAWTYGLTTPILPSATWLPSPFWRSYSVASGSSVGLASVESSLRCTRPASSIYSHRIVKDR